MYNPQLLNFKTTDNIILPGLLYKPKQNFKKVAIWMHGCGSASIFYNSERMNSIAQIFNDKNIAFFPFNNRGAHLIKTLTKVKENSDEEEKDVTMGTIYEQIKDCIYDIDGAINHLKKQGYNEFYLIGHSTGANKIAVYNYYKPKNEISKYVLLAGGDDTGIYYTTLGEKKFINILTRCKKEIEKGNGEKLVPKYIFNDLYSYQALYDVLNPDGDYNTFPFNEYMNNLHISTKKLFREYNSINKPTLVIYGEYDEFCYGKVQECINILKKESKHPHKHTFNIIQQASHSFTGKEKELATTIAYWLMQSSPSKKRV